MDGWTGGQTDAKYAQTEPQHAQTERPDGAPAYPVSAPCTAYRAFKSLSVCATLPFFLYGSLGGALCAPLDIRDKVHTAAAEAAAPAAAPAAALAAAPADPWIHGSISFIMNHIFYYEMRNM